MQHHEPGFGFVGEYQVSGLPWVTQSIGSANIDFPYVTQWVLIKSSGANTTVAFTQNGLSASIGCRFTVASGSQSPMLPYRVKSLYVSGGVGATWEVIAGLTMIPTHKMPTLSASFAPGVIPPFSNSSGFGYGTGLG